MPEDSGQEKTHDPTPERLKKAREEGLFAFSREVVTAFSFLGVLLWISCMHQTMRSTIEDCLRDFLSFTRHQDLDASAIGPLFVEALRHTVRIAGPLLALALGLGLFANVAQVGFQYAPKKKIFDMSRLDPVAGFGKMCSASRVFEGAKAVLKALLFTAICYWTVHSALDRIVILGSMAPGAALDSAVQIAMSVVFRAGLLMLVFAAVDYAFQWRQYRNRLMMSHQELKEEYKELEGDPLAHRRQRQRQMELSRNRMISSVRKSDVVVTNPTHYAVALKYDAAKGGAPRLVAKGARLLADRIKEEARRHRVPVVEDRFVARSIYFGVKLGQEIPQSLYRAVAEILAYVYHITGKTPRRSAGKPPGRLNISRPAARPGLRPGPRPRPRPATA